MYEYVSYALGAIVHYLSSQFRFWPGITLTLIPPRADLHLLVGLIVCWLTRF